MNFNIQEPNLIFTLGEALSTQQHQVAEPSAFVPVAIAQRSAPKGLAMLPPDFTPTDYSVVLGRGKGAYNYIGNKRCRVIVKTFLQDFYSRETRSQRAVVVAKVIDIIKEACPIGSFVKIENGVWYQVSDKVAREKIFTMFRDVQNAEFREARRASCPPQTKVQQKKAKAASLAPTQQDSLRGLLHRSASLPPTQPDPITDIFHPIWLEDDDSSAAESMGSRTFFDIDCCSLCTL